MTINERIQNFINKYPEPIQHTIGLYWKRAGRTNRAVIGTGTPIATYGCRGNVIEYSTTNELLAMEFRYDDDLKLMEVAYIGIDGHVPNAYPRRWKYKQRYFIPKEEKMLYNADGSTGVYWTHGYRVSNPKNFFQIVSRKVTNHEDFRNAFLALTDSKPDLPPRFIKADGNYYHWVMSEWIVHKPRTKSTVHKETKYQRMIKELAEVEMPLTQKQITAMTSDTSIKWSYAMYDAANQCFRIFKNITAYTSINLVEQHRVFYRNGRYYYLIKSYDKWIGCASSLGYNGNVPCVNLDAFFAMEHKSYLRDLDIKHVSDVVAVDKVPEYEQLANMGLARIARSTWRYGRTPNSSLKDTFGEPIKGKKNFCQKYGITAKQLRALIPVVEKRNPNTTFDSSFWRHIRELKDLYNVQNISDFDPEKFAQMIQMLATGNFWRFRSVISQHNVTLFEKMLRLYNRNPQMLELAMDTNVMMARLRERPDIDVYKIKTMDEMTHVHDQVVALYNVQREEDRQMRQMADEKQRALREQKMKKVDEKRQQLNYEDDNFLIRLPKSESEIVTEGAMLHHCVGGYASRHALGDTTILFLRRKNDPDKSFYTIELTNSNNIQQIHGFGNRWLGNDADAIPTVVRWLRKNNITCTEHILTNTSEHYGATSSKVDMPIVDGKRGI